MSLVPIIETERLKLREHRLSDFEAIAGYWESDRTIYTGGRQDRNSAWQDFSADAGQWIIRGYGMWIAEDKESGKTAGFVGFHEPIRYKEAELGWIFLEEFEGKGMAYEAALAARQYGAEHFGITAPFSFISAPNQRSIVLAEKLGATLERIHEGKDGAVHVYRHPTEKIGGETKQ